MIKKSPILRINCSFVFRRFLSDKCLVTLTLIMTLGATVIIIWAINDFYAECNNARNSTHNSTICRVDHIPVLLPFRSGIINSTDSNE